MASLATRGLRKVFSQSNDDEVVAVRDLCLDVPQGEFHVLAGPAGSGKSTILRLIAGLEAPTSGEILIDGKPVTSRPPRDRDVAMILQQDTLYPHLTARENIALGLKLRRTPRAEIERRVAEASEMLGLTALLERRPEALSGGERQQVSLGRALVRRPGLFLFDEPLCHLDAVTRSKLRKEIAGLHARLGATVLYVTHDQTEAMTLARRVVLLKHGTAQQSGTPMDLYHHPATMFAAGFLGTPPMNLFAGVGASTPGGIEFRESTAQGKRVLNGGFSAEILPRPGCDSRMLMERAIVLGLRAEDIHVHEVMQSPTPAGRSIIHGRVELVERLGHESWVHLTTQAHGFIARAQPGFSTAIGESIPVALDMSRAQFFDPKTELVIT